MSNFEIQRSAKMHDDWPSNGRVPVKIPPFQDAQASLKNGRYPLTLDMSRL